jgi:trans-aconitate methyltransferase
MTLVDLSEDMLAVSRRLNPECDHLPGDMRSVRLGREFDAVFIHDAIDYMLDEADLRLAFETAFVHCRPGGVAVIVPDSTTETFAAMTDHGGIDGADGRGARYLVWAWDPNPDDTSALTEYAFLLREADGSMDVVHETHRCGLFPHELWLRLLTETGFRTSVVMEETVEDRTPRDFFVAHRPLS